MRTTVSLDDDVATGVEQLRRSADISLSEAVNRLARNGLGKAAVAPSAEPFHQEVFSAGLTIDVTCAADALELLDGASFR